MTDRYARIEQYGDLGLGTDEPVAWEPVHAFVGRLLAGRHTTIICGTPEWIALDDDDPRKTTALIAAGNRWVLEQSLAQIDQRRIAAKHAAIDIAEARDWARVAKGIRDRDAFYREHPDLKRKVS